MAISILHFLGNTTGRSSNSFFWNMVLSKPAVRWWLPPSRPIPPVETWCIAWWHDDGPPPKWGYGTRKTRKMKRYPSMSKLFLTQHHQCSKKHPTFCFQIKFWLWKAAASQTAQLELDSNSHDNRNRCPPSGSAECWRAWESREGSSRCLLSLGAVCTWRMGYPANVIVGDLSHQERVNWLVSRGVILVLTLWMKDDGRTSQGLEFAGVPLKLYWFLQ